MHLELVEPGSRVGHIPSVPDQTSNCACNHTGVRGRGILCALGLGGAPSRSLAPWRTRPHPSATSRRPRGRARRSRTPWCPASTRPPGTAPRPQNRLGGARPDEPSGVLRRRRHRWPSSTPSASCPWRRRPWRRRRSHGGAPAPGAGHGRRQGAGMVARRTLRVRGARRAPSIAGDRVPVVRPPHGCALVRVGAAHGDMGTRPGCRRRPRRHPAATARLRHVAHLGVRARPFSYVVRGLDVPSEAVRVELTGPRVTLGVGLGRRPPQSVQGPALDFCLVVTQRRNVADTALTVQGSAATEWMAIAQAFAGPPGPGRPPGRRRSVAGRPSGTIRPRGGDRRPPRRPPVERVARRWPQSSASSGGRRAASWRR